MSTRAQALVTAALLMALAALGATTTTGCLLGVDYQKGPPAPAQGGSDGGEAGAGGHAGAGGLAGGGGAHSGGAG